MFYLSGDFFSFCCLLYKQNVLLLTAYRSVDFINMEFIFYTTYFTMFKFTDNDTVQPFLELRHHHVRISVDSMSSDLFHQDDL